MIILFVAVFKPNSTNNWQAKAFEKLGHDVIRFEYRERPHKELLNYKADVLLLSKCNGMDVNIIKAFKGVKILWYMDGVYSFNDELKQKIIVCDLVFCSTEGALKESLKLNINSYINYGGYDPDIHKLLNLPKKYDVSFIGTIKGHPYEKIRHEYCEAVGAKIFNSKYGLEHSKIVSQSKINLNFCAPDGTSNRLYKIMAAGGLVLSMTFKGWDRLLLDSQIFKDIQSLKFLISLYLHNEKEKELRLKDGRKIIKQYDNINFAKRIIEKL